jgi:hypothetical protein
MSSAVLELRRAAIGCGRRDVVGSVVYDYELSQHELNLLLQIARTVDSCEQLQARRDAEDVLDSSPHTLRVHPALPELKAQRLALSRRCHAEF